jgi:MscS family membrane protein
MLGRSYPWFIRVALIGLAGSLCIPALVEVLLARFDLARAAPKLPALTQTAEPSEQPAETAKPEEEVARDSPRASMADFFALARTGQYAQAARYLDLPRAQVQRGAVLARRMQAVLDRRAWVDLDKLSPLSSGDLEDDLPRSTDEIGRFVGRDGAPQTVRLVRRNLDGGRWLFSESTVSQIDGWYEDLADVWMLEHLPRWLLRSGPKELLWWQWLALPILVVLGFLLGYGLSRITSRVLGYVAARTPPKWDDALVARINRPLTLWWGLFVIYVSLPWLRLYEPAHVYVHGLMQGAFLAGFFWILSRAVSIGGQLLARSPWAHRNRASRSLIPLIMRVGHVALFAIGVIALLSHLGYPVASLLAGLGVGGLAVALAAQKTLENLFGAFAIGADQPFREGDFVRIDDFMGTVESIGLRSTKFRTLDRTLITIPNGKLSDMKLESFAARDRLRFTATVRLVYGTSPEQVRRVIAGLERTLRAQPKLWPDGVTTRLLQLGSTSLEIEVAAWFDTVDFAEFQRIREEVLLSFVDVTNEAGADLFSPVPVLHAHVPAAPP